MVGNSMYFSHTAQLTFSARALQSTAAAPGFLMSAFSLKKPHCVPMSCNRAFKERMIMFGYLADKAKALSESVTESVVSAKDAVLDSVGEGANTATAHLEKHWPAAERVLVDGLLTVAHDRIKDDEVFLLVAEKAFELLPAPVRLLLPRSAFLAYSEKHRVSIVEIIEEKRQQRLALESPVVVDSEVTPAS